jgi:hypothetical protein
MAAGWNFQDGEQGWYIAIDAANGGSVWFTGDGQNGARGNGTTSANNLKWVKVNLPAGDSAIQVYGGFTNLVLCDTVAGGVVLGQRIFCWGVGGTRAADLGYTSAGFGAFASSIATYNVPTEILINGQHAHNIKCLAGGLDVNYALFDSVITGRPDSTRVYFWGQYGWRGNHSSTVGSDQVNKPADITARIYTQANALGYATDQIDTIVCDMASTHILYGSGGIKRCLGWGSSEQGTMGNGEQLNFATYSPPYDDGGANESTGALVQFTAVDIAPGRTDFAILLNGGYYAYANQAMLKDGRWVGWGRNKPAYLPVGTKPIDGLAGNLTSVQPQGWQRPYVTIMPDAFSYSSIALSTSQGCFNACTAGPVTGSPCSLYTPTCYTTHAHLTATAGGTTVYLNASTSTSTGYIAYCTFSQTTGTTTNMGIVANISTYADTLYNVAPGTYTYKVVIIDQNWGTDSTTASVTVAAQTGFYFAASGGGTACTIGSPCAPSYFNTQYALETGGDTNYLNRGDVFPIEITANVSGIGGNPIVTTWYGTGPEPIVGGMGSQTGFSNVSGNLWQKVYAGVVPNFIASNRSLWTVSRTPNRTTGYSLPSAMTANTFTDAFAASRFSINDSIVFRSWPSGCDKRKISNIVGNVLTVSTNFTFNNNGAAGDFRYGDTPDTIGEFRFNSGNLQVYSTSSPTVLTPNVDTCLLSEGTNQVWDHIHFSGGNNANVILAFQAISNVSFTNDTLDYGFDAFQFRSEGGVTMNNVYIAHMTDNGVLKQNNNNYNNTFTNVTIFDAGNQPGMGGTGNSQFYSGLIAGDSGSIVTNCLIDSVGYVGIAAYGSGFRIDSNVIYYFCQQFEDGGAIYTWMNAPATFARQRYVLNNIMINGGGPYSHNGSTLDFSSAAVGGYADKYTQQVTFQYNAVVNVNSCGFMDHGPTNNYLNNIVLGAGYTQFFGAETAGSGAITGLVVKNNQFGYNYTTGAYSIRISTPNNDLNTFGTIDSNYYLAPYTINNGLYTFSSVDNPGTNRTLASWRTNTGYDLHSSFRNVPFMSLYYVTTPGSTPITGFGKDVFGNFYTTGSITLGAYLSALLQRVSLPNLGPVNAGGMILFR